VDEQMAATLKTELSGQIPAQKVVPDRVVEKLSADAQIQLF